MFAFRKLLHSRSFRFFPRNFNSSSSSVLEGFGGSLRFYSEQKVLRIEDDLREDEVERIRREFNAAKQSFLEIPLALNSMHKMNPDGIYVNKNLRLDRVQVYGFDYDYTLAHYSANLQALIYDLAKEHLVNELRYPESCLKFKYDKNFPIRGLYYDKLKGCLMKLDFFGSIEPDGCYFGRRKLKREEIIKIYGTRHIGRQQASGLVSLMDFFCFSEACLIADIVQHFVDEKLEFDASYVYHDVNHAIQHVHRSGVAHKAIISDPQRYLVKNGQLYCFLKMLRENGKKLFLLTNSPYYFVDGGMRFLLEICGGGFRFRLGFVVVVVCSDVLAVMATKQKERWWSDSMVEQRQLRRWSEGERTEASAAERKKNNSSRREQKWQQLGAAVMLATDWRCIGSLGCGDAWRELFDVVIAKANKPDFYTSDRPFRCYDTNKDTLTFSKVDAFLPKNVYYHGCLKSFLQITQWHGPEVIYFGDHLFSDLRGPSKAGWRTAAIIQELENEIQIQNEDTYRFEQAKFHIIQELLGRLHSTVVDSPKGEAYKSLMDELNEERQKARCSMKDMFNKAFGATFLTDTGQESSFAYHIHQYADVYTSKPENFMFYPPEAWLHVSFDVKIMPHHVKVPSSLFKT